MVASGSSIVGNWTRLVSLAVINFLIGALFGSAASSADVSPTMTIVMSATIFAGASQFAVLGVLLAGGSPYLAWLAAVFVNVRYLILGVTIGSTLKMGATERIVAAHFLIDPTALLVQLETKPSVKRRTFWQAGITIYLSWMLGTVIGTFGGTAISDPERFGLDMAVPILLLALLGQGFRGRGNGLAATSGAAVAVVAFLFVPSNIAVLLGCLGALIPMFLERTIAKPKSQ